MRINARKVDDKAFRKLKVRVNSDHAYNFWRQEEENPGVLERSIEYWVENDCPTKFIPGNGLTVETIEDEVFRDHYKALRSGCFLNGISEREGARFALTNYLDFLKNEDI